MTICRRLGVRICFCASFSCKRGESKLITIRISGNQGFENILSTAVMSALQNNVGHPELGRVSDRQRDTFNAHLFSDPRGLAVQPQRGAA